MSPMMLGSQGLVLATAMVVSSTVLFLTFSRQKTFPLTQLSGNHDSQEPSEKNLRSCLSSGDKKRERKKKKVKFAENVKEPTRNGEEFRNEQKKKKRSRMESNCRNEIPGIQRMPPNRVALYNGILKDRVHRMECSF